MPKCKSKAGHYINSIYSSQLRWIRDLNREFEKLALWCGSFDSELAWYPWNSKFHHQECINAMVAGYTQFSIQQVEAGGLEIQGPTQLHKLGDDSECL
jgi:hypothetical protein